MYTYDANRVEQALFDERFLQAVLVALMTFSVNAFCLKKKATFHPPFAQSHTVCVILDSKLTT
jgi:hypothetical protein